LENAEAQGRQEIVENAPDSWAGNWSVAADDSPNRDQTTSRSGQRYPDAMLARRFCADGLQ